MGLLELIPHNFFFCHDRKHLPIKGLRATQAGKSWNYFTNTLLLGALRARGTGGCGIAKHGFPEVFSGIDKKTKLDFHFKSGVVLDNVAVIIWIDSAPVNNEYSS
jgi:hypothetical protein